MAPPDQTKAPLRRTLGAVARRSLMLLVAAPFSALMVVLLLADRAPGYAVFRLGQIWGLGSRVQQRIGIDVIDRSDVPLAFDQAGHVALWFVAGLLAVLLLAHRFAYRHLIVGLLAVATASEVGQRFLTSERSMEFADAVANGIGVVLGVAVGAVGAGLLAWTNRVLFGTRSLTG